LDGPRAVGFPFEWTATVVVPAATTTRRLLLHPLLDGGANLSGHLRGGPEKERGAVSNRSSSHEADDSALLAALWPSLLNCFDLSPLRGDGEVLDVWNRKQLGNRDDCPVVKHSVCLHTLQGDVEPHFR
jgi:hypothetical protein